MRRVRRTGRLPAFALAAAALFPSLAATQEMTLNERLALCGSCHGRDGNSPNPKIPSLAGQPEFFLLNQLILMREGVRPIEQMAPFVGSLRDDEIAALASHFARLPAKRGEEKVDPALVARGETLARQRRCASCHLPSYAGTEQMPRLAKQRIDYLYDAMKALRDNERKGADSQMSAAIFGASDDDLLALAHYVASR
jgi:cytochrome c553